MSGQCSFLLYCSFEHRQNAPHILCLSSSTTPPVGLQTALCSSWASFQVLQVQTASIHQLTSLTSYLTRPDRFQRSWSELLSWLAFPACQWLLPSCSALSMKTTSLLQLVVSPLHNCSWTRQD